LDLQKMKGKRVTGNAQDLEDFWEIC
jgi:hypothetical protein